MPPSPHDSGAVEAEKARQDAARAAENKVQGRRATIVAGAQIALDEQMGRGLLAQRRRSRSTVG